MPIWQSVIGQSTRLRLFVYFLTVANQYSQCGASWLSGSVRDVQARDRGYDTRLHWVCSNDVALLDKALCLYVHSLDPGVSGYLVGQFRAPKMAAPLYAPRGVEMAYERTGPVTRG